MDRNIAKEMTRGKAINDLAKNVNKSKDHIRDYLDLFDLPQDIQDRLHRKEISFTKARELTRLTKIRRDYGPVESAGYASLAGSEPVERTKEHFDDIRRIADKAAERSIKSVDTVKRAVDFVREGVYVDEAIRIARKERAAKKSQERVDKADSPEEIARRILKAQPSREELEKAEKEVIIKSVAHLLRLRMLACPHCGGDDLVWACNGSPLLERKKDEACSYVADRRLTDQTYLKRPNPRFALILDDRQLTMMEQLLREEVKICSADSERRKRLKKRIVICREILGRIDSLKGEAR